MRSLANCCLRAVIRNVAALPAVLATPIAAQDQPPYERAHADTASHTGSSPPLADPNQSNERDAVKLAVVYTFDFWRNTRGGLQKGERYLDNLDVILNIDGEKAIGWVGATVFLYGIYNNGHSLTDQLVGDLQTVSNIDAGSRAARLYEAWVEQRFADDRASIKLGLYDLNSEFDRNDSNALFLNSSHGIGPDFSQSGENGPSIFPVTSLALRSDFKLTERLLIRAALLDGVPGNPDRPRRTAVKLRKEDGTLTVAELEYRDETTKVAGGWWRYSAKFAEIFAAPASGKVTRSSGNDGFYVLAERKLTGRTKDGVGLAAWARLGMADDRFNLIRRYLGGGLVYTGLVPGRDADRLGVGVSHAQLGNRYRRHMALIGEEVDGAETNIELTYRVAYLPWLTFQPDVQYVVNPGANRQSKDALVLGLRFEVGL